MIGQYLPQTYENATVAKSEKISHLNKALVHPENQKVFKIHRHIESFDTCINH